MVRKEKGNLRKECKEGGGGSEQKEDRSVRERDAASNKMEKWQEDSLTLLQGIRA